MADTIMSLSIIPYLLFLYLVWRIRKLDPTLLNKMTFIGFCTMLGFVFVTASAGITAVKIMNAPTLGHVDWLHGLAESGLTITNGLIAIGLRRQLDNYKASK